MKPKTPKISVVFDYKHESTPSTPGTVWVRIYESRSSRKYISTHVRVLPSQWDDTYHVIRHPSASQLNAQIDEQVNKCTTDIRHALETSSTLPTTTQMKLDRSEASFLDWMAEEIEKQHITDGTRKHHQTILRSLEEFGRIRRFEDVTPSNIEEWFKVIKSRTVSKMISGHIQQVPISQPAIHNYWKRFLVYIHIAQKRGLLPSNCLGEFTVPRGNTRPRIALTDAEMDRWQHTTMPSPHLERARLLFIIEMATGLAFRDLMLQDFSTHQQVDGVTVVTGNRVKTDEPYFAIILPFAIPILKEWHWKLPTISNVKYNLYLKEVARILDIRKKITSHVARHTFACHCLRNGVRIEAIQRMLGHSRLETTQIYATMMDMDVIHSVTASGITKRKTTSKR